MGSRDGDEDPKLLIIHVEAYLNSLPFVSGTGATSDGDAWVARLTGLTRPGSAAIQASKQARRSGPPDEDNFFL